MTDLPKPTQSAVNKIFGDELPQKSIDERDSSASADEADHDKWLRDNVPPHHD